MIKTITAEKYLGLLSWLKAEREAKGVSMRQLAAKINQPHSFINKIESGERRLDVYEYVQYCAALKIDPSQGLHLLK
ncbi:MAG: helix-turn-helix transcriptional regulator [Gammaproteobacteria bacterium]|jgi:transcriptional regulator with XRE-family HTH domain|nr:helix-turn-helix transcriptional regulator [Gammaproteobacteria bacterium]MBT4606877.1 helix-turn-helix transcriptional regulator [Thiotrichales bacterium]MBT3473356.1 helix-turn-helix transcriptional regulator [Gammaproteobacteria bacterium]MBT3967396.1 helix-turn-helix transcriptional regulator [Gammaproteobacteria bacterium]MBT4080757.1 helix-turn-helix transcriptional regulator [Gammaproteobacteria bacterium]